VGCVLPLATSRKDKGSGREREVDSSSEVRLNGDTRKQEDYGLMQEKQEIVQIGGVSFIVSFRQ
jgi:hypothetical protein